MKGLLILALVAIAVSLLFSRNKEFIKKSQEEYKARQVRITGKRKKRRSRSRKSSKRRKSKRRKR